jgi:hypothetical protein
MPTAAVFLDAGRAFDTTWHLHLLHRLFELHFPSSLIKLICPFLSNRKFIFMAEGELSTPPNIKAEVPQVSFLYPTLYSL